LWVIVFALCTFAQPVLADPVKIMPFGTWTAGYNQYVSYRYDLWFQLIDAAYDVDFVGSRINSAGSPDKALYPEYYTTFDRDNEALHRGLQSSQMVEPGKNAVADYQPDIVLVWMGPSDIGRNGAAGVASANNAIRATIAGMRSVDPGITFLLSLTHRVPVLNAADVAALNDAITTIAQDMDTLESPVLVVDQVTGFDPFGMSDDGVHHNRAGEAFVANNWFKVLADILPDFDSEPEPFQINSGHAGAWYNPVTPGQGQLIDVEPENKLLFLSWFAFTDAASADPNEQHWFTAQGNYSGDSANLVVYETLGGKFDDPQAVSTTAVNVCEERTGLSTELLEPNDGRDGAWFDAATPGQGFLIDAHPNPEGDDFIFVAWFTYGEDTTSGQRWLTAQGPLQGSMADLVVYETLDGSFDDPKPSESSAVGTMTIDFTDCSNALLSYSITDEVLVGMIEIERAIPGTEALCEELTQ
jgi:hypothetical protein